MLIILYFFQLIFIINALLVFKLERSLFNTHYTLRPLKYLIKAGGTFTIKLGQFIINKKKLEYEDNKIPKWVIELDDLLYNIIDKNSYTRLQWINDYPELKNYENFKIINSGSIGSVFLIEKNNKKYALKIQHSSILKKTQKQIKILKILMNIRFLKPYVIFSFDEIFSVFLNQFNFNFEGDRQVEFYEIFKERDSGLLVPKIYYKDDRKILMEYIPITFINNNEISEIHKLKSILKFQIFLKYMFLEEGLLHLDLHSGNWGINNNNLTILDFGYSLRIYEKNNIEKKKAFQDMWIYMYTRDKYNFISQVINYFITETYTNDKKKLIELFMEELKDINIFHQKNVYSIILNFCNNHKFKLSNEFYFIGYYLNFTIGIATKYFKFDKDFDDQNLEELYNSHLVISKYEDIIFEQYPLFQKYKFISDKILEILNNKKNILNQNNI
jgi:predicted unusual protein kinase regulating ubiquinone biosynthesis (AarF/ABC1/UbiB family)